MGTSKTAADETPQTPSWHGLNDHEPDETVHHHLEPSPEPHL